MVSGRAWTLPLILVAALAVPLPALAQQASASASGIEAAMTSALARHPAVTGKQAQVDAKVFARESAGTLRYPSVSAQVQRYSTEPRSDSGATGEATPASLRVRQPLWAFGRIDSRIAYADADTSAEQADLLRVRRQLLENTAVAYANVQSSRRRLKVADDSVDAHVRLYDQIQRREQGQLASRADVGLAAARLAQARARQQRYAGELDIAVSDLLALTLAPVGTDVPVPTSFSEVAALEPLLEQALQNSADVRHKQQLVERAEAAVAQVRTAAMPTVYLQGERLYNQPGYRNDSRVSVVVEGALEGLGFTSIGQTKAAEAQVTAARQDLLASRNDITRSVRRLYSGREMQRSLVDTQSASLQDLATLLDSYKRQYEAGTKSWLDVLNIQREVSEQHLQQVQAESDWLVLSLQLKALAGGLDAPAGLGS